MKERVFLVTGFILSYLPLWIIICFECILSIINRNKNVVTEWFALLTIIPFVIISIIFFLIILYSTEKEEGIRYHVLELTPQKWISSEYLLSYVIPLVAFDFTQWQDMAKLILLWGFIFILCWRFWQMPIAWLGILGYYVADCKLKTFDQQVVYKQIISHKSFAQEQGEEICIVDFDKEHAIYVKSG